MRTRSRSGRLAGSVLAVILLALSLGTATAGAASRPDHPVPYTFLAGVAGFARPYTDPPGTNQWNCRPGRAHPNPVVLVHGFASNINDTWQTYGPLLANEGYCVFALNYGVPEGDVFPLDQFGGRTPMESSAVRLSDFVNRVLRSTGASDVDLLGHSEGTQMANYYLKRLGGAAKVDRFVALAPFWRGTNAAGLATAARLARAVGAGPVFDQVVDGACAACRELLTGSDYYRKFGYPVVPGVEYTSIVTRYDELAVPYTSGIHEGMHNITLQDRCSLDLSEHFAILADRNATVHVLNALDPAHPRPLGCVPTLPFVA